MYNSVISHRQKVVDYSKLFRNNKKVEVYIQRKHYQVKGFVEVQPAAITAAPEAAQEPLAAPTPEPETGAPPLVEKKYDLRELIRKTSEREDNAWRTNPIPNIVYMFAACGGAAASIPLDFKIKYMDISTRDFISANYDETIVCAFDNMALTSYKIEFWKYCVLYKTGGIYIDNNFVLDSGVNLSDLLNREHFCQGALIDNNLQLYGGFMVCRAGNPILLRQIQKMVDCVKTNTPYISPAFTDLGVSSKTIRDMITTVAMNDNTIMFLENSRPIFHRKTPAAAPEEVMASGANLYHTNDVLRQKTVIPLHVYQTWYTKKLPVGMKEAIDVLKEQNPEFEFHLYDDNDCREFIVANFPPSVVNAFDKLVPGAYKADLWRYCIMYIYGGMYLDCKYVGINNFKLIDYAYDEYFVLDCNNKYIYNAFLICKPGNKIMYECIYRIVKHVDEKFYGVDALAVTGPAMLSEIYCNYDSLDNLKLKHNFFGEPIEENTSLNTVNISEIKGGSKTIFGVYPNYRKEQYAYQKTQHYSVCWHDKKIYA